MYRKKPPSERDPDRYRTDHRLGLDLGQSADPSALTVTRRRVPVYESSVTGEVEHTDPPQYAVVWIQRFDLGTPYRDVVRRTAAVRNAPETGRRPPLVMDATGVGAPVTEMFKEEGLRPVEILFTSGDSVSRDGQTYRVPKKDLATTVQRLLQSGQIKIVEDLELAPALVEEMKRFRVKYTEAGNARFEHAQESDTDDVLLSLACALWHAESRSDRVFTSEMVTF
jgi:hypothetical protein